MEVSQQQWGKFCERVNQSLRGAMVSMRLLQTDGTETELANNVPLRSIALDTKTDPCNDRLVIEAGLTNEKPIRHQVVEPIHVRLKDGGHDRYNHMHILAENGTTIVTFHPGLNPAVIEGVA